MYGLTRATTTVFVAAAAGFLLWIATRFSNDHVGGHWARMGLLACAGLVMALPRLKLGSPRVLITVLLFAFVPVAIASIWVIAVGEPGAGSFHNHVLSWTRDIRVSGLVTDLLSYAPVLAFGTGLVFGYSFEATRPRIRGHHDDASSAVERHPADAPPPADRARTVETRDSEPAVTEASPEGRIDRSSSQNLQSSERASIHQRIGAYTLARAHDQARAERRSGRDRRSGSDRRQAQVEPFDRSWERRATGERRSGIDRRGAAQELNRRPAARRP